MVIQKLEFPLLVKFLDANDNLSVQVHPDDEYARIHENDSGKTESWYVLHAEPGAKLIYGHNATSKKNRKIGLKWKVVQTVTLCTSKEGLYICTFWNGSRFN